MDTFVLVVLVGISVAVTSVLIYWVQYNTFQLRSIQKHMATIADLEAEIQGELTNAVNAIIAKLTELAAAVAAGADTSAQIAELHTLATNLQNAVTPPAPPAA